jgi:uncharacterized protein YegP (UPF0339 family)
MAAEKTSGSADGRISWASGGAAEGQYLQRFEGYASNDRGDGEEPLDPAIDSECRFELFRCDEERMTSTLFTGGDWRWRLVTTDGLILAEAGGYPNEGMCRAAVAVLRKRAASAPVVEGGRQ